MWDKVIALLGMINGTVKDVGGAAKDAAEGTASKIVNIQDLISSFDPLANFGQIGHNDILLKQLLGQFGLSIEQMSELRETMYDNGMISASLWGKELKDVIELQVKYNEATGRSIILGRENYDEQFAITKFIGDTGTQYTQAMQNFNQSVESAYSQFGVMYDMVEKNGLNLKKVSDSVVKNLQMADRITFRDGTAGLMSMAVWADKIKFSMQNVEGLVNKVTSNFESTISMSAKLQVLGGPFTAMADPLAMMEEGFNDPESLARRMASMIGNLATFDSDTGEFNLKGMYPQLAIRQYAEQTGISVEDARRSAKEQARRQYIESQLGSDLTEQDKSLISSKAEYDKITQSFYVRNYKGERVDISDINQSNITSINSNVAADADPQTRMYTAAMNSQGYMELFGNAAKAMALGQQQLLDESWANDITKFGLEIRDSLGGFATSIKEISDMDLSGTEKIKAYFGALNSLGKKIGDTEAAQSIMEELEKLLTGDLNNSKTYGWIETIASSFVGSIWEPLMGEINEKLKQGESHWGEKGNGVNKVINDLNKFVTKVITPLWDGIVKPFAGAAIGNIAEAGVSAIASILEVEIKNIPDIAKAIGGVIADIFGQGWDKLKNIDWEKMGNDIGGWFKDRWNDLTSYSGDKDKSGGKVLPVTESLVSGDQYAYMTERDTKDEEKDKVNTKKDVILESLYEGHEDTYTEIAAKMPDTEGFIKSLELSGLLGDKVTASDRTAATNTDGTKEINYKVSGSINLTSSDGLNIRKTIEENPWLASYILGAGYGYNEAISGQRTS